jgi:spoIIIJ-associated protein
MEDSILFAKKYLEDLLSFFGLNVEVYATSEDGEVIELNVPSTHLNGFLIGNRGDNMRSMQYLISMALKSKEYSVTRVNVDIADYKKQRAGRLEEKAIVWIEEVKKSGEPKALEPMNSADRRTIHRLAGEHGIETVSEGEGRDRHIVLQPTSADSSKE